MKILASILALFVLFLSVQPALALLTPKQQAECCGGCCQKVPETPKQEQPSNNNCQDTNCNPFLSCGCCIGYTVAFHSFIVQQPLIIKSQSVVLNEHGKSEFFSKCWQPPKIS